MVDRPRKVTFAEMRSAGVHGLLIFCADYRCSHLVTMNGDRWPDEAKLSDIEPRFVCEACGHRGADVWCRPKKTHKRLRGTGILARAEQGHDVDQIANDIGMSRQNVEHCMRFKDQMKVDADGPKRPRVVSYED